LQYRWGNENRLYRISGNISGSTSFGTTSNDNTNTDNSLSSSTNNGTTKTPVSLSAGLSAAILKLRNIHDKFGVFYGGVAGISYSYDQSQSNSSGTETFTYNSTPTFLNSQTESNSQILQPYVGLALGLYYKINSKFILYAEIDPNVYYAYYTITTQTTNQTYSNNFPYNQTSIGNQTNTTNKFGVSSLSNSGASLTIVYRITYKH
jgi:hypothetical protein